MTKPLQKQALSASLPTTRPTKTVTRADGSTVTLVALPVMPPSGFHTIPGVDYRSNITLHYDAAALMAAREKSKRSIPLDINHNIENCTGDQRSRGWDYGFTTPEAEPGIGLEPGLHAWFELSALGAQELADRLYGYTSVGGMGRYLDENNFLFTDITSLALTNKPAAAMAMAFSAQSQAPAYTEQTTPTAEDAMLEKILSKLGLTAEADEAAVEAAIDQLQTSAAVSAQFSAVQTEAVALKAEADSLSLKLTAAQADLTTATVELSAVRDQLTTITAQAHERDCVDAVAQALSARKITPAQKDAMLAFARADLKAFSTAMGAATEVLSAGTQSAAPAAEAEVDGLTPDERAFCAAYGYKESSYLAAKQARAEN